MVFSSVKIVSAAKLSAEAWQSMACFGERERIEGQQMLDLVLCFPLQQLGRLILYVWTYLCVSPHPYYSSSIYNDDDEDDEQDLDFYDYYSSSSSSTSGTYHRHFYYPQVPYDDSSSD